MSWFGVNSPSFNCLQPRMARELGVTAFLRTSIRTAGIYAMIKCLFEPRAITDMEQVATSMYVLTLGYADHRSPSG